MRTNIISRASDEIISLQQIKDHCRVDDTLDDNLLASYLAAATNVAEKSTNRLLNQCTVEAYVPKYSPKVYLPYGAFEQVLLVTATNPAGESETIAFTENVIDQSVMFNPTLYSRYTDFIIQYRCGYGANAVPDAIIHGMLMLVATMYNVREDISYGIQGFKVPLTSKMLFDTYKIHAVV